MGLALQDTIALCTQALYLWWPSNDACTVLGARICVFMYAGR